MLAQVGHYRGSSGVDGKLLFSTGHCATMLPVHHILDVLVVNRNVDRDYFDLFRYGISTYPVDRYVNEDCRKRTIVFSYCMIRI